MRSSCFIAPLFLLRGLFGRGPALLAFGRRSWLEVALDLRRNVVFHGPRLCPDGDLGRHHTAEHLVHAPAAVLGSTARAVRLGPAKCPVPPSEHRTPKKFERAKSPISTLDAQAKLYPEFKFTPFDEAISRTCKWFEEKYETARK